MDDKTETLSDCDLPKVPQQVSGRAIKRTLNRTPDLLFLVIFRQYSLHGICQYSTSRELESLGDTPKTCGFSFPRRGLLSISLNIVYDREIKCAFITHIFFLHSRSFDLLVKNLNGKNYSMTFNNLLKPISVEGSSRKVCVYYPL